MEIKILAKDYYKEAMELKVHCATEELAGLAPNNLDVNNEAEFLNNWIDSENKYNDIRLVYSAFIDREFAGFIGSSFIEGKDDIAKGIEINYLFIKEKYRGLGVSLKLLEKSLDTFGRLGVDYIEVYNYHNCPSNKFYRKLGGIVVRTEIQDETYQLPVDIFAFDLSKMLLILREKISKRYSI